MSIYIGHFLFIYNMCWNLLIKIMFNSSFSSSHFCLYSTNIFSHRGFLYIKKKNCIVVISSYENSTNLVLNCCFSMSIFRYGHQDKQWVPSTLPNWGRWGKNLDVADHWLMFVEVFSLCQVHHNLSQTISICFSL